MFIIALIFFSILSTIVIYGSFSTKKDNKYILILGAGLDGDRPYKLLKARCDKAIEDLKEYKEKKVICCGKKASDEIVSEAIAIKRYLQENGIEKERIILEEKSHSTFTNLKYAKELLNGEKSITVATSNFHALRVRLLGKRLGLDINVITSKTHPKVTLFNYTREVFALVKSLIFDW